MPRYIISGRVPGWDEDVTEIIDAADEHEANEKFADAVYDGDTKAEQDVRESYGEWEPDERAIYVTSVTLTWESDLVTQLRSMLVIYESLKAGEQEWNHYDSDAADAYKLLEEIEGKEKDGPDVEESASSEDPAA